MQDDHRTPFKLVTSKGGSARGTKLFYEGQEIEMLISVSVENLASVDEMNRSKIVIELYGDTEVVREDDGS